MFKKKKNDKLKIDEKQLSNDELKGNGITFKKGLLIFCIILLAAIIVLSVFASRL